LRLGGAEACKAENEMPTEFYL